MANLPHIQNHLRNYLSSHIVSSASNEFSGPNDVTSAAVHGWWSALTSDGYTVNGSNQATAIIDLSGNGNDADTINGTAALSATGGAGNGPRFTFARTDDWTFTNTFNSNKCSVFMVARIGGLGDTWSVMLGNTTSANFLYGSLSGDLTLYMNGSVNGTSAYRSNNRLWSSAIYATYCWVFDGDNDSVRLYENYRLIAEANINDYTINGKFIIGTNVTNDVGGIFDWCETVIFDGVISEADRIRMVEFEAGRWNHHPTSLAYKRLTAGAQRYYATEGLSDTSSITQALYVVGKGQSNMVGTNTDNPAVSDSPVISNLDAGYVGEIDASILTYAGTPSWVALDVGVNNRASSADGSDPAHGLEPSLVKDLYDYYQVPIYWQKEAVGGTSLYNTSHWNPNGTRGNYYYTKIAQVRNAQWEAGLGGINLALRHFVWWQGEDDADTEEHATGYEALEAQLVAGYRDLLIQPSLGDVLNFYSGHIVRVSGSYPYPDEVNTSKTNNAAALSNYYLFGVGDDVTDTHDNVHRTSDNYIARGSEVADLIIAHENIFSQAEAGEAGSPIGLLLSLTKAA